MIGFVIYRYNGQTRWTLNGRYCETGYTFVVNGDTIKDIDTTLGTWDAKAWKYLFGNNLGDESNWEVVGSGFSIKDGEYTCIPGTFNKDDFYDKNRPVSLYEKNAIKCTLDNWRYDNQRIIHVKDMVFSNEWGCCIL